MGPFNSIELIALVLIVITVLKLIVLVIAPDLLLTMGKKMARYSRVGTFIAAIFALGLFLVLTEAGVSISTMLAVLVLFCMIIMIGMFRYYGDYISWVEKKGVLNLLKEMWLYLLVWVLLLGLGIYELFF